MMQRNPSGRVTIELLGSANPRRLASVGGFLGAMRDGVLEVANGFCRSTDKSRCFPPPAFVLCREEKCSWPAPYSTYLSIIPSGATHPRYVLVWVTWGGIFHLLKTRYLYLILDPLDG
jgi:hypothetical protein